VREHRHRVALAIDLAEQRRVARADLRHRFGTSRGARTIPAEEGSALAEISVAGADPGRFHVTIEEPGSRTEHEVTASTVDLERLGSSYESPEDFVRACFAFLLEREPKESILRSFDVSVIGRYFPEFESSIGRAPG
jgi:hypothetical protein